MMYARLAASLLVAAAAFVLSPHTLHGQRYTVPRTAHGHPDFQGVWATAFLTMLERVAGVDYLVASPEQADALAAAVRTKMPALIDPDVHLHDIRQLLKVKGEYRTSIVVDPPDGRMPFTKAGLDLAARITARNQGQFDHPEERPLVERCLENLGDPPMRAVPVFLPRQIVQTRDAVVIASEDAAGPRIIHLAGDPPPETLRTISGYSRGRWEGDTLVVQTTHLRADDPARTVTGRPMVISRATRITERFTRASESELFYRFTIEDAGLYTQPWSGEFSMTRHDGPTYEYGCHEGNYSLPNALRGGQAEAARLAAGKPDRP